MTLTLDRLTSSCRAKHELMARKEVAALHAKSGNPATANFGAVFKEQFSSPAAITAPPVMAPPTAAPAGSTPAVTPSFSAAVLALPNGGLMSHPTGNNALSGGTIPYNPNYYATFEAASLLAQQTGGSVVNMQGQFSNNQPEYYVDLPNGISVNAGNVVAICNNPVYQGNTGIIDHMIAEVLNNNAIGTTGVGAGQYTVKNGQITYDPNTQVATPPPPYRS